MRSFGADASVAFATALERCLKAEYGTIYFPAGVYQFDKLINIELPPDCGIAIRGDGPALSSLRWSSKAGGISIRFKPTGGFSGAAGPIIVEGLGLFADAASESSGLRLHCEGGSGPAPKKLVRDVILAGWAVGIDCIDCTFTTLDNIDVQGSTVAIRFSGDHDPVDNYVRGLRVLGARDGIEITGASEGIYVEQATMLSVERGVHWHTPRGEPLLSLSGSHIAASRECVLGHNLIQPIITGNLFYQAAGAAEEWAAVRMTADNPSIYDLIQISHNTIHGFPSEAKQRRVGIVLDNRTGGLIQGNIIQGVDAGIVLTKTSREFKVLDNIVRTAKRDVLDEGIENVVRRV